MSKNDKSIRDNISSDLSTIEANVHTAKQLVTELDNLGVNDGTESLRSVIVAITDASVSANKSLRLFNSNRYAKAEAQNATN